ncbi:LacI family transcriptional regulator [Diaphorobacter sp. HDW4B]|uniref:LacI family DNA-binding transcriptional regulator n=1 Tax=Diaphorobacter sp. HDW4B TaxID=2714925 RepID=UPI0014096E84|nr:LacI family DNA-binding transcriptional regulator [Diaphorobacter sp. HDW4B]QIL73220.1 LacI family transcriptional regulator [Diaphorobacter sp. HDW4B]
MTAVTIDDVAKAAGVHAATVSRALRGVAGKVSAAKRAEIEEVARRLGYQPNIVAASLRTKRSNMAAIIVPDLANPLFAPMVKGLEQELRKHDMLALITQPPEGKEARASLIQELAMRQVSGLLILAAESGDSMLEQAALQKIPTVLVNRGLGERRFSSVVNDDQESVRLAIAHLRELGHTRIAHIAGPVSSSTGAARKKAFVELMAAQSSDEPIIVDAAAFTRAEGVKAARKLFEQHWGKADAGFTAVFASNDLLALGVLDVAREKGVSVPDQLSLVGHNDMPFVDIVQPPLTTIHVPVAEMGRQAAQVFLEQVKDCSGAKTTRVLSPSLVVRESTARVAGD